MGIMRIKNKFLLIAKTSIKIRINITPEDKIAAKDNASYNNFSCLLRSAKLIVVAVLPMSPPKSPAKAIPFSPKDAKT